MKYTLSVENVSKIEKALAKGSEATVKIERGQIVVLAVKKEKM